MCGLSVIRVFFVLFGFEGTLTFCFVLVVYICWLLVDMILVWIFYVRGGFVV